MTSSTWFSIAIALNVLYLALMFAAVPFLKAEAKSNSWQWLQALTLWWPIHDSLYENTSRIRRLRLVGFVVLLATAAAYALALV